MKTKQWLLGLLSAVVSTTAAAFLAVAVTPEIAVELGMLKLAKVSGIAGLIGAANYLKQSPVPPAAKK